MSRPSLRPMPTIHVEDGYRFFFYSNEGHEPPHIPVEKAEAVGKWWLEDRSMANSEGFKPAQLKRVEEILSQRQQEFIDAWRQYFG